MTRIVTFADGITSPTAPIISPATGLDAISLVGNAGKVLAVSLDEEFFELIEQSGSDMPILGEAGKVISVIAGTTLIGMGGKVLAVNEAESGFELVEQSGGTPGEPSVSLPLSVLIKNTEYTITTLDDVILCDSEDPIDIYLPGASTFLKELKIKKIGIGSVIIHPGGVGELIDGMEFYELTDQWDAVTLVSKGTQWFIL
jgi:hypothetical protein